jgi:hypothetical protein
VWRDSFVQVRSSQPPAVLRPVLYFVISLHSSLGRFLLSLIRRSHDLSLIIGPHRAQVGTCMFRSLAWFASLTHFIPVGRYIGTNLSVISFCPAAQYVLVRGDCPSQWGQGVTSAAGFGWPCSLRPQGAFVVPGRSRSERLRPRWALNRCLRRSKRSTCAAMATPRGLDVSAGARFSPHKDGGYVPELSAG